jgi:pyrroloquinoline quinone biosynthesis protein D
MPITETSKPSLAVGSKWGGTEEDPIVLYPEGAMKVHGTSLAILALCDGERTFNDIIEELKRQYFGADPARIREDATKFLETMHDKRIVDY